MLNRITLRQIEYFVATAESGSIINASEKIHVSSPSISAAIAHMENELKVQLFTRSYVTGLQITPVGEHILRACQFILMRTDELYSLASDYMGEISGLIKIGCFAGFAPMIYAEVINGFISEYPKTEVNLVEEDQQVLIDKLVKREIDIALTYDLSINETLISFEPLATLPPHVLVSENHPLANQKIVSLNELVLYPMVLLDMPHSSEYLISLFQKKGLSPKISCKSKSTDVVRSMVANDLGYAIFNVRPKLSQSLDGKPLVRLQLKGNHRPMKMGLATNKLSSKNNIVNAFVNWSRELINDQDIPGMQRLNIINSL